MLQNLFFYLFLTVIIVLLIMLAKKIRIAYPVLLVLAGLAISFIPGTPRINIEPELIFFIFLPPLLYEALGQLLGRSFGVGVVLCLVLLL